MTTKIETVQIIPGNSGQALGTVLPQVTVDGSATIGGESKTWKLNGYQQAAYGNNRWKYSAIRQYLNSDANAGEWWHPQHVLDRAPDIAGTKKGWLAGTPEEFRGVLTPVKVLTAIPNANESAGEPKYDVTYDKVFLPSLNENYITPQEVEGEPWEYWMEINGTATKFPLDVDTPALKVFQLNNHNATTYRWMRSCYRGYGCHAWRVSPSGRVNSNHAAGYSFTSAPACAIC
jgi:hypothetical protein